MKQKVLLFIFLLGSLFFINNNVLAYKTFDDTDNILNSVVPATGITSTSIPTDNLPEALGFWANVAYSVVSVIFLILMVYAGFLWMTARGSEEVTTKAKNILTTAIIGLIILVSAYAITSFVVDRLVNQTSSGNPTTNTPDLSGGPEGCCVDWAAGAGQTFGPIAIPACRITTEADCKFQGENKTDVDVKACPGPKDGCWIFDSEVVDPQICSDLHC